MKRFFLILLGLFISSVVMAQVNTVQPSIMVIPFVPEGADMRKAYPQSGELPPRQRPQTDS